MPVGEHGEVRLPHVYAQARSVFQKQPVRAAVEEEASSRRPLSTGSARARPRSRRRAQLSTRQLIFTAPPPPQRMMSRTKGAALRALPGLFRRPRSAAPPRGGRSPRPARGWWRGSRPPRRRRPRFLCSTRPTERSISLSFVARPPPRCMLTRPTPIGVDVVYVTSKQGAGTSSRTGAWGRREGVVDLAGVAALGRGRSPRASPAPSRSVMLLQELLARLGLV